VNKLSKKEIYNISNRFYLAWKTLVVVVVAIQTQQLIVIIIILARVVVE